MAIFPVFYDLVPMCNLELLFLYLDVLTVCTYTLLEDQGDYQKDIGTEMTPINIFYKAATSKQSRGICVVKMWYPIIVMSFMLVILMMDLRTIIEFY